MGAGTYIASDEHPAPEKKDLATQDYIPSAQVLRIDHEFLDIPVHVHMHEWKTVMTVLGVQAWKITVPPTYVNFVQNVAHMRFLVVGLMTF